MRKNDLLNAQEACGRVVSAISAAKRRALRSDIEVVFRALGAQKEWSFERLNQSLDRRRTIKGYSVYGTRSGDFGVVDLATAASLLALRPEQLLSFMRSVSTYTKNMRHAPTGDRETLTVKKVSTKSQRRRDELESQSSESPGPRHTSADREIQGRGEKVLSKPIGSGVTAQ